MPRPADQRFTRLQHSNRNLWTSIRQLALKVVFLGTAMGD